MKLPVYMYGHPVLREVAEDVPEDFEGLQKLVDDMFETMYDSEGVGLAGPQIGKSIRLVVIDADPVADTFPECAGRKLVLINPEVEVLDGDPVSRSEGCLSLPGIAEDVKRVEHIRLLWTDEKGEEHDEVMSGFLARIVQHECDHLEGHVFIDHVPAIRRALIRGKLNNIVQGKVRCDYRAVFAPQRHK